MKNLGLATLVLQKEVAGGDEADRGDGPAHGALIDLAAEVRDDFRHVLFLQPLATAQRGPGPMRSGTGGEPAYRAALATGPDARATPLLLRELGHGGD